MEWLSTLSSSGVNTIAGVPPKNYTTYTYTCPQCEAINERWAKAPFNNQKLLRLKK